MYHPTQTPKHPNMIPPSHLKSSQQAPRSELSHELVRLPELGPIACLHKGGHLRVLLRVCSISRDIISDFEKKKKSHREGGPKKMTKKEGAKKTNTKR